MDQSGLLKEPIELKTLVSSLARQLADRLRNVQERLALKEPLLGPQDRQPTNVLAERRRNEMVRDRRKVQERVHQQKQEEKLRRHKAEVQHRVEQPLRRVVRRVGPVKGELEEEGRPT